MGKARKCGPREKNGQVLRSHVALEKLINEHASERENLQTVIEARMRVFGIADPRLARDQLQGTFIGRLLIAHQRSKERADGISQDQYNAAQNYLRDRNAWQRAIGAKADYEEARPETAGVGDYEEFCRRAKAQWGLIRDEITECMMEQRDPAIADSLDKLVVRDMEYWPYVPALRVVLNRLAKFYFETGRRAA